MKNEKSETTEMKVRDLMTGDPITSRPDVSVERVLALMQKASIRHIPIVDDEGLVGVVSDRDLAILHGLPGIGDVVGDAEMQQLLDAPVSVVMKSRFLVDRDVVTVEQDEPIKKAINLLIGSKIGALPVVDDADELVGVLSPIDVLRWTADEVL